MSFLTCFWDLPQKLHLRRSPPSPNFATSRLPLELADACDLGHLRQLAAHDHLIDDAVLPRFVGAHDEVSVGVLRNLVDRLSGVMSQDRIEQIPLLQNFSGLDLD